jgi:hypothetical protein
MVFARPWRSLLAALILAGSIGSARSGEFRVEEVASATALAPAQLKPATIAFADFGTNTLTDPATGLMPFEDWARARPIQQEFLTLFPGYVEPTIEVTVNGLKKPYKEKLHVYVVEARFLIPKAPDSIDLKKYLRIDVLKKIDPAIEHHLITADETRPHTDMASAHNRNPNRRWCEEPESLCVQSRYQLEGKLPLGVRLANKLEDSGKKISEFIEFQTELRVLPAVEADRAGIERLTRFEAPVTGVLEQTLFDANQVIQFGKLLAVLQADESNPSRTIATVFLSLGVETDVLERKKEFETVPVLRNLIPSQVLMGKSSFNSGTSLSAGLPDYTRNRIRAFASLLQE